ncbi:TPA: hypothetical protein ACGE2L_002187 [Acinetobacter baumannii]|uniref:hypothetical protein n=1 Tax=Acinetobacter baumannii TaxID=470 RepID=UPI0021498CF6|nr:hypothetical protein [Acinetobacter baumannii]MCQ9992137.1 hypothetical protein [Acinetobacter baumannii]
MKKSIHVIAHTPITLDAFKKRQKQIKLFNFLKKIYQGTAFICMFAGTFSFLFLGK